MFSSKPNYMKLRTNLRLCINRLKLLEKKKTELALKARREIADYIQAGKDDRARIRVEHIIREDYLVEAMEIVEMLCDLLLARFGMIEKMAELDPGIEEAVATLIWVAPRLCGDIQELREVALQLTIKYGKEFAEMCRRNGFESVHEKVVHKMSLAAPPKLLVEHYMIEIARTYKVPFEPDPLVMMGQPPEVSNLIDLGIDALSPASSCIGPSPAEMKAAEAGHSVMGGGAGNAGPFVMPSVPGSAYGNPGTVPASDHFGAYIGGVHGGVGGGGASPAGGGFDYSGGRGACGSSGAPVFTTVHSRGGPVYDNVGSLPSGDHTNQGNLMGDFDDEAMPGDHSNSAGKANLAGGVSGGVVFPGTSASAGVGGYNSGNGMDLSSALVGGVPVLPAEGQFPPPVPSGYLPPSGNTPSPSQPSNPASSAQSQAGPAGARPPMNPQMSWINDDYLPSLPSYDQVINSPNQHPSTHPGDGLGSRPSVPGSGPSNNSVFDLPTLPDVPGFPSIPSNSLGGASVGGDDVDFDDLTRRFEELKKRK